MLVRDQRPLSSSSACSRKEQCCCGRGIAQNEGPQRLENRFDGHQALSQGVPNRSFCFSPDSSTEPLRQLATRFGCDPCRCVHDGLDELNRVRIPPIQFGPSGPLQNQEREGNISLDCSPMVGSTLVASIDRSGDRLPNLSGERSKSPDGRVPPKGNLSSISSPKTGRMENIRQHYETAGLSSTAIDLLTNSVKTSTTKAYNCSWSQWSRWCEGRESDPVLGPVSEVLTFLAEQFEQGKQYRTINVLRLSRQLMFMWTINQSANTR